MTDKVQKIREEVEKRYEYWKEKESNSHSIESEIRMSECQHSLLMLDSFQKEPVSEEFEKIVEEIAEPTILNAYGTKELARRLRNTICGASVSEELEEAAKRYATEGDEISGLCIIDEEVEAFKAGANYVLEEFADIVNKNTKPNGMEDRAKMASDMLILIKQLKK